MPRKPGPITPGGAMWLENVAAQGPMRIAEDERRVGQPLAHGVGLRGAATALEIDKATVIRRHERDAE